MGNLIRAGMPVALAAEKGVEKINTSRYSETCWMQFLLFNNTPPADDPSQFLQIPNGKGAANPKL
jgi:hypothetical protein